MDEWEQKLAAGTLTEEDLDKVLSPEEQAAFGVAAEAPENADDVYVDAAKDKPVAAPGRPSLTPFSKE